MSTETDQLASDYTAVSVELAEQTTQIGDGFYQLNDDIDFEEFYPNGIIEFIKTDGVKQISDSAGITTDSLQPPIVISDEIIDRVNEIFDVDFLDLSSIDKTLLSSEINDIIDSIPIPTQDQITEFLDSYSKFVAAAAEENVIIPSKFREVQLASTDISLDSFIKRTNTRKTVIIGLNNLTYPFITARFKVAGVLQATLVDATGSTGDELINYTALLKESGVEEIKKGNEIIITNSAKNLSDLKQQKTILV
ncbi:hypothetical protein KAR91_40190, partial [Candidatus Pacearchaeota archaeon]|nr:hypothetical protein [Candidatus Pacearchaeota archaeon]